MATNSGIEVTALRPAAQAGDFYVRPDQTSSGIEQGLARLAGTMSAKKQIDDKATAENLHISDSLNNAKDIHDFSAYAHESAGVVAHLKELRGRSYANRWRTETENLYKEFSADSDEQGGDYHDFMAKRKAELAEAFNGDRFMISGAMGVMNEADQNMRAVHRQFLDQRMRTNTKIELESQVDVYMDSFKKGNLRIQDAANQIDDAVQTAHNTGGITNTKGNESVFLATVLKYKQTGDPDYYLLAHKLKYAKGKGDTVNTKSEAILGDAFEHVEAENEASERAGERRAETQKKEDIQTSWDGLNEKFWKDPNYVLTYEDSYSLTSLGVSQGEINRVRDSYAERDNVKRTDTHVAFAAEVRAQINETMFDPDGVQVSTRNLLALMTSGQIHPDDMASLQGSIKSAQNASPLLQSPDIRDFKHTMVERVKNSFYQNSPTNAASIYQIERNFDLAFVDKVKQHFAEDGAGTPPASLLRQWANESMQSSQKTEAELVATQNEFLQHQEILDHTAELSSQSRSYAVDTNIEEVNAVMATKGGKWLKPFLDEDPTQTFLWPTGFIGKDFEVLKEQTPAWKILEMMVNSSTIMGGSGAYYFYRKQQKAINDKARLEAQD